jgi:predicted glycoside hydrolase/deacetylase ChbG (UPF0249 family)
MNLFPIKTLPLWNGALPKARGDLEATLIFPVPVGPRALIEPGQAAQYLILLYRMMKNIFPRSHEILLAPYGESQPAEGNLLRHLVEATGNIPAFRWISGLHEGPGSAVRAAVFSSQGCWILVGNLEYYYETSFFTQALKRLRQDSALTGVRANRRLSDAEFMVPVKLLSMVYRRHLLGLFLTKVWSALFAIGISDALSGAYALRRDFALRAFNRVTCPWFLYGAELAVLAKVNGHHLFDIPAHFSMEAEKSRLRLWGEIYKVLFWTFRLILNVHRGEYDFLRRRGNHLTADDWGLSPGVNEGILQLARLGHLKRVSVLGGGKYAAYKLKELKRIPGIEFGLHFNLTCPEAGGFFLSPFRFFAAWMKGKLWSRLEIVEQVRKSLRAQLKGLQRLGLKPVRFDGHHHVHAMPGLLDELSDILKKTGIRYVRVPHHWSLWISGRMMIAFFGMTIRRVVNRHSYDFDPFYYPTKSDFSGFNQLVRRLNRIARSEILIHPAARNDIAKTTPSDTYREERVQEFRLFRLLALEIGEPVRKNAKERKAAP